MEAERWLFLCALACWESCRIHLSSSHFIGELLALTPTLQAVVGSWGTGASPLQGWEELIGLGAANWGAVFFWASLDNRQATTRSRRPPASSSPPRLSPDCDRHVWAVQNHKSPEWGSLMVSTEPRPVRLRHGATADTHGRKIPWRLSPTQKFRQRKRLQAVDQVVATVANALAKKGETLKSLERWNIEMPTEAQMLPRDKYTMFDRKAKRYRKGIHSMSSSGPWSGWRVVWLTVGVRTPQVDPCVAENQPARFLDDGQRWCWRVYPLYYTNWNKRRYDGIKTWRPSVIWRNETRPRPVASRRPFP